MGQTMSRRQWVKVIGATGALGGLGLLGACGGGGSELPVAQEAIGTSLLGTTPANQAATYRHVDLLYPTRTIRRGTSVLPLPACNVNLNALKYESGGITSTVDDYMGRNRTGGMVILKGGAIALERYGMGNDVSSRWTSFSTAKSVTSTLIGAALRDGSIRSLDDGVALYLPQFRGSAYEQNSIRDLLRMTSGIGWNETYITTRDSDIARLLTAMNSGQSGAVMELMRTRPRVAAPGSVFNYSTGESYVLGAIVAAATGSSMCDYLSKKVWAPMGMEADGYWVLDSVNGQEMGGNNFSATLRDYARFGLFFLRQGVVNGISALPVGWQDLAGHPDNPVTGYGQLYVGYPLGYGYQWWAFPTGANALPFHDGAFTAEGIFGQFIYVNPKEDIVAVVWSAWPTSWVDAAELETYALIGRAVEMLR